MQNRLSILLRYISDNADEGFKMILHREEVGGARSTTKDEEKGPAFQPPASSNQYVFCNPANLIFIVPIFPLSLDYLNSHLLIERPYPEQNPYRLKEHHSPYLFVHPGGDEKQIKMTN